MWQGVARGIVSGASIVIVLAWVCADALAQTGQLLSFSQSDIRRIRSLGPWPPNLPPDPSNRVSGKPAAIELGERLFFSAALSGNGSMHCASCHVPARTWTDGRARGSGLSELDRNTPTLENLRLQRWYGWDGANDTLWAQSIRPLLDQREMHSSVAAVARTVRQDAQLASMYAKTFGRLPGAGDERVLVNVGKALAAFQETIVSARSPFDAFRDALVAGDLVSAARYPEAAQRGLTLFIGRGNCIACHAGPAFSNGEFHEIGIGYFITGSGVDSGRHGGIARLRSTRLNLLGPYNDDRSRKAAIGTRHLREQQRNFGEFRTPGLRNVVLTAPYMHNGSLATLCDVVNHYSELNEERLHADGERILKPLRLIADEKNDLVAFLESLTGVGRGAAPAERPAACGATVR